jgi:hypothetical protein
MSRNKCSSEVRISHILRFISNCDLFTGIPSYVIDNVNLERKIKNGHGTYSTPRFEDLSLSACVERPKSNRRM